MRGSKEQVMSEQNAEQPTEQQSNATADSTSGFTPPATQDELNRIINERLQRERAKYADYKDLKSKAAKFDELEQANQTEVEKANNRVSTAEAERDQARSEALRLRVAAKHSISEDDADLFLTGTDEETLTRQAKRLSEHVEDRKKSGNYVAREGTTSSNTVGGDDEREAARQLFGGV